MYFESHFCGYEIKEYNHKFLKKFKKELPSDPAILLFMIYPKQMKKKQNTSLKRYLHPQIHSSIICSRQEMGTT